MSPRWAVPTAGKQEPLGAGSPSSTHFVGDVRPVFFWVSNIPPQNKHTKQPPLVTHPRPSGLRPFISAATAGVSQADFPQATWWHLGTVCPPVPTAAIPPGWVPCRFSLRSSWLLA